MMTQPQKDDHQQAKIKLHSPDPKHLAALTEFAAAAGHEINNPLAVILGRAQLLLNHEKDEASRQSLETIAGQALRIRDMIGDVMLFADPPLPDKQKIEIPEIIPKLIDKLDKQLQKQSSKPLPQIFVDIPEQLELNADLDQFQTVIAELLRNALHPSTGSTEVALKFRTASSPEPSLEITVRDDGRGLTQDEATHLFDPFYSGRQAGRGLGFGLCKAWRFVTLHQGSITVEENDSEKGVCVRILWPIQ